MLQWMTQVSQMTDPPLVFSISYGADEDSLPPSYGNSFNTMAMKLAVRGISITVSSGDDGALSTSARKNPLACGYHPSFPASSPYVTALGATMVSLFSDKFFPNR
jgi:tripeptidyl-peptidase-1